MIHVLDVVSAKNFIPDKKTIVIRCMSSKRCRAWESESYGTLNKELYVGLLSLVFDDLTPMTVSKDRETYGKFVLFGKKHSNNICRFLDRQKGNFEDIMVHCYAGLSRSTAVGAAIGGYFSLEYNPEILERHSSGINSHVYNTLLQSFMDKFPEGKL
jgi:hypothetical protein